MRIHLLQVACEDGEPMKERVVRVADQVRACAGADLVVLPELWPQGGFAYDRWDEEAEGLDGPTVAAMSEAARAVGAYVHAGSVIERADGRLYNTSVLLGPDGSTVATYRKIHLFGFSEGEATLLTAGEEVVTCPTPFGTLGLATCYDLRFPEMFRRLVDAGAEILVVPAAWPQRRVEHWRLLARARAVESQAFVLACNAAGVNGGVPLGGHSIAVDPWGEILAEAGTGERELRLDVTPAAVARTREEFPVLRDRRLR